jgi:hypothetical protein
MVKTQYSETVFKKVLKTVPRPKTIAFIGKDVWQFNQAKDVVLKRFLRDLDIRPFNMEVFDSSRVQRVSSKAIDAIDLALKEQPLATDVRVVLVTRPGVPVSKVKVPHTTVALYFNPTNPQDADEVFTIYPLYGRRLSQFIRSFMRNKPLGKLMGDKESVSYLASNLYTGDTGLLHQELTALNKLAVGLPDDFIKHAKRYVEASADVRTIKIYKLLAAGPNHGTELVKFIHQTIFRDKAIDVLQVFNIFAQHFFMNIYLSLCANKLELLPCPENDNKTMAFIAKNMVFDKVFRYVTLKPQAMTNSSTLSAVPSINLKVLRCPGPRSCGKGHMCSLAAETLSFCGASPALLPEQLGACPFQNGDVYRAVAAKSKALSPYWLYLLTGDKKCLSGEVQINFPTISSATIPFRSSIIKPLGVKAVMPSRPMSSANMAEGIDLFQKADQMLKIRHGKSEGSIMALFTTLVVYLNRGTLAEDSCILERTS